MRLPVLALVCLATLGPLPAGAETAREKFDRLANEPGNQDAFVYADGGDRFFCGGGNSGKVRAIRRPRRGSAAGRAGARAKPVKAPS